MSIIYMPPFLQPHDHVAIVASAGKIAIERIMPAVQMLKNWDLNVHIAPNVGNNHHRFAATDAQRLSDLQAAMDDPNIKAIFAARGGYGLVRIIDQLNLRKFTKNPKWIVGYSDITILHSYIYQKTRIPTLHAELCTNFPIDLQPNFAINSLKNALFGTYNPPPPPTHPHNRVGSATGVLVGGNLSILYSLLGSKTLDTRQRILFIEDIAENYYHIDRMLHSLRRAGKLAQLSGLMVGGFTNVTYDDFGASLPEIILNAVKNYDFPVAFGIEAGHILRNQALMMGSLHTLKISDDFTKNYFGLMQ